jgi:flagellar hook-associated protein 2
MSVENQPLLALETRETGVNAQISAFGKISSALSTLQTSAQALELSSAFEAATATVTGSGTTATVTGTPATGTYAVGVSQLAQSQAVASSPFTDLTAAVGSGTLTFQLGTYNSTANTFTAQSGSSPSSITIDSTNNTPAGIAAAINDAGIGIQATVVNDVSGGRLLLSSSSSGAANGFKITVADGSDSSNTDNAGLSQLAFDPTAAVGAGKNLTQTQAATNAQFTVNGLALSSASNAVTGVISGLTLNLTQAPPAGSAAGTTVQSQVTVGLDTATVQASVQSMVTAYNAYVNLASTDSAYNTTTNTAAVLNGDSALDSISQQLSGIFASTTSSAAASGLSYLSQVGVQFQADGTLSLDATTFTSALTANPTAVAQLFSTATGTSAQQGFAYQIDNSIENMLLPDGTLSGRTDGLKSSLTDMAQQQADLQARLATDQTNLTSQYSALNAALETMQQQSTALTSMLSSLTTTAVGG